MKTTLDINGIPVEAYFHNEDIERIIQPLLEMLTRMQKEKGRRLIVMIAAPPGAGKSTLVSFLEEFAREAAERFVDFSDMRNVRRCLGKSKKADLTLKVHGEGRFEMISGLVAKYGDRAILS